MLQFIIPIVNLIEVNNIACECKHIQQSLIILGMCDMTQTKRKRSVIATGDLHLRESLSIPLLRCDFVDLFIVETFSHPKISSIRKHFPTCKDILTREATKHKERIVSTSFLSRQNVIFEKSP